MSDLDKLAVLLESDTAFRAAEERFLGEFGAPDFEEEYADLYGALISSVLEALREDEQTAAPSLPVVSGETKEPQ